MKAEEVSYHWAWSGPGECLPPPSQSLGSHKSLLILEVPGQLVSSGLPQPQPSPTCHTHAVQQTEAS